MHSQDHSKNHSSGHEGHGVHVCHKCGWPFPNPHPSAKHRRAHKKVCGNIEGYKLDGSEEAHHLPGSDDEHLSDGDHKSPSPKILERNYNEKGSGAMGQSSSRSEYGVFSDAVAEIPDSGSSPGIEQSHVDVEKFATHVEKIDENRGIISHSNEGTVIPVSTAVIGLVATIKESKKSNNSEDLIENVAKQNEDANLDVQVPDALVFPVECAEKTSDMVSEMEKTQHTISDAGDIQLKEETKDSNMISNNQSTEVESVDFIKDSVDIAQIETDVVKRIEATNSSNSIESLSVKGEANENRYVFSLPADLPAVDNPAVMVEGFKDHKEGRLPQIVLVDSLEIGNAFKGSIPEGNSSTSNSSLLTEDTEISVLDVDIKDKHEYKEQIEKPMLQELPNEGESVMPQVAVKINENKQSEELGTIAAMPVELESSTVQSPYDSRIDSYVMSVEEQSVDLPNIGPMAGSMDAKVRQTSLAGNDPVDYEKARNDRCDVGGNNDNKRNTENIVTTSEVNASANLLGVENATAHEGYKIERYDISKIAARENDFEGNLAMDMTDVAKSVSDQHESCVQTESASDESGIKSSEPEGKCIRSAQDTQENGKEIESNARGKLDVEYPDGLSAVADSDNRKDVEALAKSSQECIRNESLASATNTLFSVNNNNNASIEDQTRDFCGDAFGTSKSLPGESDNNLDTSVLQQLGPPATDLKMDSISQTDGLEGHCGSISVLSTHSDVPAVELLPSNNSQASAVVDESSLEIPKAAPEDEKSGVLEPPHLMTLVQDPKVSSDVEIQTVSQAKPAEAEAGWFPSLTNVVNESQGRKKNEETISKVTNWSAGKRHAPLKSLLSEATKSTSPSPVENPSTKDVKIETGKEWNSPARYPANIKREKRKEKGKPYWAQFVCCSSVN
ncbi:hypothetical protein K2173_018965 [Erythroxylum novogranatense]|uniref:C2H2-type domain-containing protein n=1 Tax=Erythroxylum novogranatense TaxID=1862640 RepID=A0AAV8SS86_9ROSI|nr:hypothetical protein K2173_018965 [Erythroxylum novogranatense]